MKLFIALAAIVLTFLGPIPAFAEDTGDPVTIEKDRILIPGTKISEKDQRELNAILAHYDKSLYKVKGYDKGKATQSNGALKDSLIDRATASRAATHAKDRHFTGSTLQIGFTSNQDISGRTSNQERSGATSNQDVTSANNQQTAANPSRDQSRARELVKRLTPILRKYTKTNSKR
ncbi:MAG: hypothetical protein DMG80_16740 [Acidobacteria bacterium]|nr:MAG: hypothetical protein DMG80_16740 [Acidobacteriota bacterium]